MTTPDKEGTDLIEWSELSCPKCGKRRSFPTFKGDRDSTKALLPHVPMKCPHCGHKWEARITRKKESQAMPELIREGDRLDLFRRLLKLAWDELSELRGEMVKRGIRVDDISSADGAMKDLLVDLEMEWYNPMENYLWRDAIVNYDPEFARGDGSRWERKGG